MSFTDYVSKFTTPSNKWKALIASEGDILKISYVVLNPNTSSAFPIYSTTSHDEGSIIEINVCRAAMVVAVQTGLDIGRR